MGMGTVPEKCFITGSPTQERQSPYDVIEYFTEYNGVSYYFTFDRGHENSKKVEEKKVILKGLLLNNKFPYKKDNPHYTNERLEKIIDEAITPSTPKEKLDELLIFLHSLQDFEGAIIDLWKKADYTFILNKLYFKNKKELDFYLNTLKESGFIKRSDTFSPDSPDRIEINITYSGLEYIIGLQEEGAKSKNCFIAMWFDDTQTDKRNAIKQTITNCGYKPVIIDEVPIDSDQTINDAIIRHIRSSKFIVADFTGQRHGVYFESGFALGMGKQVIYMCEKQDFDNSHFDTNHYSHIVYEDLPQLKSMLEDKIHAWIV